MMPGRKSDCRGSAFITASIFIFVVLVLSSLFLLIVSHEYRLSSRSRCSAVALNLAEAGVDCTYRAVCSGGINSTPWGGDTGMRTLSVSGFQTSAGQVVGDFDIRAWPTPNPANTWLVESRGYARGNASRTVQAKLAPAQVHPFGGGIFTGNLYTRMTGSTYTDSYDSRDGPYGGANIHSNGNIATNGTGAGVIDLDSNVTINGNVMTGPGGTMTGGATVTGTVTHTFAQEMPAVVVPSSLVNLSYPASYPDGLLTKTGGATATLGPGDFKLRRIKLTSTSVLTVNGPANIYLTGYQSNSIMETGSAQIVCNGKVNFYVDNDVSLSGTGITNTSQIPGNCMIWGTQSCQNIDCTGGNTMYAAVYAPSAEIDLSGSSDRFGAYTGKDIVVTGSTGYHYDEALGVMGIPGSGFTVSYWQEK